MIAAIVLAAGMSTRMGRLKQLLPLGERLVIQVVVGTVLECLDWVHVVVGHRAEDVVAALRDYPALIVRNPDHLLGMTSSIKAGVAASRGADAFLLCLGDQPAIKGETVEQVLAAGEKSDKGLIIPTSGGDRGHPILIQEKYAPEILSMSPSSPFNTFTRRHAEDTLELDVANPRILDDMDTPVDYEREVAYHQFGSRTQAGSESRTGSQNRTGSQS